METAKVNQPPPATPWRLKPLLPVFLASLLVACSTGDDTAATAKTEKVLHVYNWADYVAESTLPDFEARTGIKVVYDVYDASEVLETKLLTGSSGYDVVVPSGALTYRLIQAGALRRLDKSKVAECGITWLDAPADMFQLAFIYLGLDANSHRPEDLAAAEALLTRVRP